MKNKKCHGNRKLYRFKRKCRRRGMTDEQILGLIGTRSHETNNRVVVEHRKRKQIERDLSQLSISQQQHCPTKKLKSIQSRTSTSIEIAKYLKMSKRLLFCSLNRQLNYKLKRRNERRFTLKRLQLIDELFTLELNYYQYETYMNYGRQQQTWPVRIIVDRLVFSEIDITVFVLVSRTN